MCAERGGNANDATEFKKGARAVTSPIGHWNEIPIINAEGKAIGRCLAVLTVAESTVLSL